MIVDSGRSMLRTTLITLALAALAAAGLVTGPTGPAHAVGGGTGTPLAAGVEDDGAACAVPNVPTTAAANAKLPNPFLKIDGTKVATRDDWRCRREEIKKIAEKAVYGEKPTTATVTGSVTRTGITATVTDKGRSVTLSASIGLPSGNGPFPAVFLVGGFGDTAAIKAAGAATVSYDPLAVGKEGTARTNKQGAFYTLYGANSSTGLLQAWAWGVSRLIDVIAASDGSVLRIDGLGVTGCSRYGKAAFSIGAFDQRIALTMPVESGSGGVSIFRGIAKDSGAQPLSSTYTEQPWLGDAFSAVVGNVTALPVDQHEIVGMIAPRGLFIMDNPGVDWLGAGNGAASALAGAEIYKALGAGAAISYYSDVTNTTHCAVRAEWSTLIQSNIKVHLLKQGTPSSVMKISSRKSARLADWVDWTTPTLS